MSEPRFFNSAVVRIPERLLLRQGSWRPIPIGVRYGLVIHPTLGPVLIDTGYGPRAVRGPQRSALLKVYGAVLRPKLIDDALPFAMLGQLGFGGADVRRIVVTHFHPDHVATLLDFPSASFVTSQTAWQRIQSMSAFGRARRGIFLELLPADFDARIVPIESCPLRPLPFGLGSGHDIWGDGSCLTVDLPGHAVGHFGLVWPSLDPPLFYATDATWLSKALDDRLPRGLAKSVYEDEASMRASVTILQAFRRAGGRVVLCHDRVPA